MNFEIGSVSPKKEEDDVEEVEVVEELEEVEMFEVMEVVGEFEVVELTDATIMPLPSISTNVVLTNREEEETEQMDAVEIIDATIATTPPMTRLSISSDEDEAEQMEEVEIVDDTIQTPSKIKRPSASFITKGMMSDMPMGRGLETPIHPKKKRLLLQRLPGGAVVSKKEMVKDSVAEKIIDATIQKIPSSRAAVVLKRYEEEEQVEKIDTSKKTTPSKSKRVSASKGSGVSKRNKKKVNSMKKVKDSILKTPPKNKRPSASTSSGISKRDENKVKSMKEVIDYILTTPSKSKRTSASPGSGVSKRDEKKVKTEKDVLDINLTTPTKGKRPSASTVTEGMMSEIPTGTVLETPLHPRRKRLVPRKLVGRFYVEAESKAGPSSSAATATSRPLASGSKSGSRATPSPKKRINKESPEPGPSSFPVTPTSRPLDSDSDSGSDANPSPTKDAPDPAKPHASAARRLQYNEDKNLKNYGSEEDSDIEMEDEFGAVVAMPKIARIYLPEMAYEEDFSTTVDTIPCYQWPLPPTLVSSSTIRPASFTAKPALPAPAILSSGSVSPPSPLSDLPTYGPDKWHFDWRAFPEPPLPPSARREKFKPTKCGPQKSFQDPYKAFTSIWDLDIMEHIAQETNRYAQKVATVMLQNGTLRPTSRIKFWRDTTVDELYVYFTIILATGITVKSRLEEYWSKDPELLSTPGFSGVMTFDRFHLLSRCLHFQDNTALDHRSMSRPQARLFKIQPILDHLNKKFSSLYVMRQNVALDESLTQWKGWLDINQFIHHKAASVGIKTYEVCESQTGYLWRFEFHVGQDLSAEPQGETPVSGITAALVLRLLHGLEGKGYTIWMDNYYNSPALARELKCRGFDCVGTLRTNRQFVPAQLANLNKLDMAFGQIVGCTSGDVDVMLWRDKNRVALISTYHGLATWECDGVNKPTLVHDYNICMGGVDRKDQMLSMYPIERKRTRVWYKKVFRRLLNASVLNAYILYKHDHAITHRDFRRQLCRQLISTHFTSKSPRTPQTKPSPGLPHFPAENAHHQASAGKRSEPLRRICKVCKKRTPIHCESCKVALCLFQCYKHYHIELHKQQAQIH